MSSWEKWLNRPRTVWLRRALSRSPVDRNRSWPLRFIDEPIRHCAHLPQATCKNVFARNSASPRAGRSNDR